LIAFDKTTEIPVMEQFYSIQGEGAHQGKAAYFIRLAGCDVGCHWCDVKASWDVQATQIVKIDELLAPLHTLPKGICVITGGEPAMYDLTYLTQAIHQMGWQTNIETSGAYELSGEIDWICVSPKKFKAPLTSCLQQADELKVIVYNTSDFAFGESFLNQLPAVCKLYLQPEWSKEKLVLPLIIDYVKAHPNWQISIQSHKYMGVE
jgi:7-carboxy-7-deazaguanine synthase